MHRHWFGGAGLAPAIPNVAKCDMAGLASSPHRPWLPCLEFPTKCLEISGVSVEVDGGELLLVCLAHGSPVLEPGDVTGRSFLDEVVATDQLLGVLSSAFSTWYLVVLSSLCPASGAGSGRQNLKYHALNDSVGISSRCSVGLGREQPCVLQQRLSMPMYISRRRRLAQPGIVSAAL